MIFRVQRSSLCMRCGLWEEGLLQRDVVAARCYCFVPVQAVLFGGVTELSPFTTSPPKYLILTILPMSVETERLQHRR